MIVFDPDGLAPLGFRFIMSTLLQSLKQFPKRTCRRWRHPASRRYLVSIAVIAALAFLLRAIHVVSLFYSPVSDMAIYLRMGEEIFGGDWRNPYMLMPPGQPFFMYIIGLVFGRESIHPVQWAQVVLDVGSTLMLIRLGRLVGTPNAGLTAGAMWAFYRLAILYTGIALSECLAVFTTLAATLLFVRALRDRTILFTILAAAMLAAATHVRTNVGILGGALVTYGIFLVVRGKVPGARRPLVHLRNAVIYTVTFLALLVPYSLRNSMVAGKPTFLATNFTINFLMGNNPYATGGAVNIDRLPEDFKIWQGARGDEALRLQNKAALQFFKSHPAYELFYLVPQRLRTLLLEKGAYVDLPWNENAGTGHNLILFGPYLRIPVIPYLYLLPLAILGVFYRSRRMPGFHVWCFLWLLFPLLFVYTTDRFRYIVDGFIVASAALVVAAILERNSRFAARIGMAVYLVLCVVLTVSAWLRLSGPNLLKMPGTRSLSALGRDLLGDKPVEVQNASSKALPVQHTLHEFQVDPGSQSQLLFSFDYRIESGAKPDYDIARRSINFPLLFLDEKGSTVTLPFALQRLLPQTVPVGIRQSKGEHAWRIVPIPPLARTIKVAYESDVPGRVWLQNFKVQGPVWSASQ